MSQENSMGVLPDGWSVQSLSLAADVVMGQSPPGASYNEDGVGAPFFQGKAEFGQMYPTVRKWTTAGSKHAKVGDILLSVRAPVGPTNVADIDCVIGRGLAAIRAKDHMNQVFLLWFLRSFEHEIAAKGTGTTFDSISGDALRNQLINVPPLEEQEKIVKILEEQFSRLDAALSSIYAVRKKAARFRRSLLQAAFTGVLTGHEVAAGIPKGWTSSKLGDCVDFSPKVPKEVLDASVTVSFVPMPKVMEISGQVVLNETISAPEGKRRSLTYFEDGDVIFAKITPCMENGKVARPVGLVNGAAFGSTEFHVLRPSRGIIGEYLRHVLVHDDFRRDAERAMTGAVGQRRVPRKYLEAFELVLPPIDEQIEIVAILEEQLSRLDESVAIADLIEKKSSALRRSFLHAAFTGELTKEWREGANV